MIEALITLVAGLVIMTIIAYYFGSSKEGKEMKWVRCGGVRVSRGNNYRLPPAQGCIPNEPSRAAALIIFWRMK